MPDLKIFCTNIQRYVDVAGGETLSQIASRLSQAIDIRPICARVNNKTEDLAFPVFFPKMVEFLDASSGPGRRVYNRSLTMMLYRAVEDLFPGFTLKVEHSISRGYYCRLFRPDSSIPFVPSETDVRNLLDRMHDISAQAIPFVRKERLTEDALKIFRRQRLDSKVLLLETTRNLYTVYYKLNDLADSYFGPLAPDTSHIDVFDLKPYKEGILMLGRDPQSPTLPVTPSTQEKMYRAFTDYLNFNRVIHVSNVGELNRAVARNETAQLINVAEAMHDKLLGRISDDILSRRRQGGAKIILIAGPSSSGKTTSAKRLAIQLMTNLMTPRLISLDDYFVDRENTPLDQNGDYDYESIHALDLQRLNSDLSRLLAGEEINLPTFSFELGRRIEKPRPLRLGTDDILLIEGIHGLNPELLPSLDPDDVYKVYVSALTALGIDDHNWISTTDNRLLRRIVRDFKYRHTSARETIRRWPSVRRGEEKWIFPYQENADSTFNSSLIFELGVMKAYAEPLLQEVPHDCPEYGEAHRLLRFLSLFQTIPADQIPTTSLLREFLGGSSFKY